MIDALEVWRELATAPLNHPGIVRRRLIPERDRDIFLAVEHPMQQRMLVLSVGATAVRALPDLPSTRGVRTTVVQIDSARTEIRVALAAVEMLPVFATFVEDVADAASREPDDEGALRTFVTRFAHWRRLLAGEPRGGLTRQAAQGLWAELWVLRHRLHPLWGDAVVDAWTGCDGDDKDFRRGSVAVEVKSTSTDAPHAVQINGEHQLEDPGGGASLLLTVLDIDSHEQGTGESLNEAVSAARVLLPGTALGTFDGKLRAYGYADGDADLYATARYAVRGVGWYSVDGAFPRITAAQLPDGVGGVTYLLSTDACAPWRVDDEADRLLGQGDVA